MKKMYSRLSLTLILFVFFAQISFSQVVISDNASAVPDGSAMLDVQSTSGGILIPRMTSAQRTSIASPAEGLLVYDTNSQSFFIYGKTLDGTAGWIDLSSNAEIWSRKGSSVFLSNSTYNVGIGTSTPTKKLVIKAQNSTDTLLEVQDMNGNPLMVITPSLTKFNIVNPVKGKAVSGGFAVGRYSTAKAATEADLFQVTPDSTRVFTGVSGGFAVGRYSLAKGSKAVTYDGKYMYMVPDNYFIGHRSGDSLQTGKYSGKYNTFFGYQAGMNDTAGGSNVFIGYRSGLNNSGQITVTNDSLGFRNVFLGYEAGYSNTLGSDNVLLGYQAGHEVTTGGNVIAIGSGAGYNNTNNSDNIFIGRNAGFYHTGDGTMNQAVNNIYIGLEAGRGDGITTNQGSNNIYLGNQSGMANTSGINNVLLGNQSGMANTSGSNNVMLGNQSGFNSTTGLNNVFIGNNSGFDNADGINNIFIGNNSGFSIQNSLNNVFIGFDAGGDAAGGENNIFLGKSAGLYHETGNDNVYLGTNAGAGVSTFTGINERNVVLGANAGTYMDNAIDNVFIGHKAGEGNASASVTGDYNVVIGEQAGTFLTSGQQNVFLGNEAGNQNTSGSGNIFLGYRSGFSNTIGNNNTFMGYLAGQANTTGAANMFLGSFAGQNNTTGGYNTAMGVRAGESLTTGSNNIFLGSLAGEQITTGNGNILIGTLVGAHANLDPASSDNILIGYNAAYYLMKGENNTVLGNLAGSGNSYLADTLGYKNTLIGGGAGYNMRGNNNTALGYNAGEGSIGNGNVYIGYDVQGQGTESNKLYIDNSNTATPLIWGDFANDSVKIYSYLNVNNAYTFPSVDGTLDQVMKTDGAGNLSWASMSVLDATTASNGLTLSGNDVRLGGNLTQTTWVNAGAYYMGFYLNGTGDFLVHDGTGYAFTVTDDAQAGTVGIGTLTPASNTKLHVLETGTPLASQYAGTVACFQQNGGTGNWSRISIIGGNAGASLLDFGDADAQDIGRIHYNHTNNYMAFYTNNSEGVRINAVGNVGIGTATPGYKLDVVANATSSWAASIFNDGNLTSNWGLKVQAGTDDNSGTNYMIGFYDGDGTWVGGITSSGGVVSYVTKSAGKNQKVKEFDKNATSLIDKIKIVSFKPSPDAKSSIVGFEGSNLMNVFPESTYFDKTRNAYMTDKSALVPLLTKAVQEQQAKIENQEERILKLEKQIQELKQLIQNK